MRILILRKIEKNSVDDIFNKTDYLKYQHSKGTNVGNKLWLLGLISCIQTEYNQIDFLTDEMTGDYINANYDICIKPEANIFSPYFAKWMDYHVEKFGDIKLPIYVIACGAQADSYDDLDSLYEAIKTPANRFIKSVYKTGGEFCLRGYFTKELFDKLGYKDALVTGCPSLFQCGRNLKVDKKNVKKEDFKPMLNGTIELVEKYLLKYKNSEFFDQGTYYKILYSKEHLSSKQFVDKFGLLSADLILSNRLKLIIDMQDWKDYIINSGFNFSYGSRIHGNIMPILSGVPSNVCALDSRTREMAEFFNIPITGRKDVDNKSLYDIYMESDYDKFNKEFAGKFDYYEKFLIERGIVKSINSDCLLKTTVNYDRLEYVQDIHSLSPNKELLNKVHNNKAGWKIYETARKVIKTIKI